MDKDRKHAIEAAIVRIMKSRKALAHQAVSASHGRRSQLVGINDKMSEKVPACEEAAPHLERYAGCAGGPCEPPRVLTPPCSLSCPPCPPSAPQLILEVVQQLQRMFQPDVKIIKRSIENLIEVSQPRRGGRGGQAGLGG